MFNNQFSSPTIRSRQRLFLRKLDLAGVHSLGEPESSGVGSVDSAANAAFASPAVPSPTFSLFSRHGAGGSDSSSSSSAPSSSASPKQPQPPAAGAIRRDSATKSMLSGVEIPAEAAEASAAIISALRAGVPFSPAQLHFDQTARRGRARRFANRAGSGSDTQLGSHYHSPQRPFQSTYVTCGVESGTTAIALGGGGGGGGGGKDTDPRSKKTIRKSSAVAAETRDKQVAPRHARSRAARSLFALHEVTALVEEGELEEEVVEASSPFTATAVDHGKDIDVDDAVVRTSPSTVTADLSLIVGDDDYTDYKTAAGSVSMSVCTAAAVLRKGGVALAYGMPTAAVVKKERQPRARVTKTTKTKVKASEIKLWMEMARGPRDSVPTMTAAEVAALESKDCLSPPSIPRAHRHHSHGHGRRHSNTTTTSSSSSSRRRVSNGVVMAIDRIGGEEGEGDFDLATMPRKRGAGISSSASSTPSRSPQPKVRARAGEEEKGKRRRGRSKEAGISSSKKKNNEATSSGGGRRARKRLRSRSAQRATRSSGPLVLGSSGGDGDGGSRERAAKRQRLSVVTLGESEQQQRRERERRLLAAIKPLPPFPESSAAFASAAREVAGPLGRSLSKEPGFVPLQVHAQARSEESVAAVASDLVLLPLAPSRPPRATTAAAAAAARRVFYRTNIGPGSPPLAASCREACYARAAKRGGGRLAFWSRGGAGGFAFPVGKNGASYVTRQCSGGRWSRFVIFPVSS